MGQNRVPSIERCIYFSCTLSPHQELEVTKARLSETEKMCSESESLLDREKSSTVNLQQQLTDEQGTSAKVILHIDFEKTIPRF